MSWSSNNNAHACLYSFEKWHHKESGTSFKSAGEWSTDFLIKSVAGDSVEMRNNKSKAHALLLDEVFISLYTSKYEVDFNQQAAVSVIEKVLKDNTMKMSDLGIVIDEAYEVHGEIS